MNSFKHDFVDAITHPYPNFNGSLADHRRRYVVDE